MRSTSFIEVADPNPSFFVNENPFAVRLIKPWLVRVEALFTVVSSMVIVYCSVRYFVDSISLALFAKNIRSQTKEVIETAFPSQNFNQNICSILLCLITSKPEFLVARPHLLHSLPQEVNFCHLFLFKILKIAIHQGLSV